jgi:hypothetical protein
MNRTFRRQDKRIDADELRKIGSRTFAQVRHVLDALSSLQHLESNADFALVEITGQAWNE